ncbi:MAG TPA: protein kinase [Planctomycetaceae bacterium]|nr:protein kinase [Planctomycetaceae bacterium]
MNLADIDRICDRFEQRLQRGDAVSLDQFLADERLRAEIQLVEELRRVEEEYRQRRPAPARGLPAATPPEGNRPEALAGEFLRQTIGPYALLRQLGEGGMGVVYLAEQSQPVARRVALKIIKPGMDSRQVIARFEAERQALSLMDHPHVARVLDAGTTAEGRPYFVMELVEGIPITRYCDERRLDLRERLELFVPLCLAVQHAHQKGIIHRDLKPSNVLVARFDERPVPKVIDFGLAKAIGQQPLEQTLFTQMGQIVGTIDYMSPEQASFNPLDVDTRTDVYSLGVLLYELLTGQTPFDKERLRQVTFDELLRILRQEEPPRPSARLSSQAALPTVAANRRTDPAKLPLAVRGELDWIVMKALDKDRSERYETASALARDVQRYLDNEAVAACPPSMSYRLRKLVSRHKAAVASTVVVALSLLLGLIGTSWQAIRATLAERDLTVQRDRAQDNEGQANASLARAVKAEHELSDTLWNSLLAQAQARRWSGRQGQRFESLAALQRAAAIRPTLELRNEAIACLALMDVKVDREWDGCPGGPSEIPALSFDRRLERYARSDARGNVSVRRVSDDRELHLLPGTGPPAIDILFSPDGIHIALLHPGNRIGHIHMWKLEPPAAMLVFSTEVVNRAFDFRPDGVELAVAKMDRSIQVYRTLDGQPLRTLPAEFPFALRFHPQGRQLAVCDATQLRVDVCDAETGELICRFPFPPERRLFALSWHPEGEKLAMAWGGRVALGNVRTGLIEKWLDGHPHSTVDNLAYNHAGDLLVSDGWDGRVVLWEGNDGTPLLSVMDVQHRGWGPSYQFGPDDDHLGYNVVNGKVQLWDVMRPRELLQMTGDGDHSVAFHPAGRLLAILDDSRLRIWDFALRKLIATVPLAGYWSIHFHPKGESLMAVNAEGLHRFPFRARDSSQPERITFGPVETLWKGPFLQHVSISPVGSKLAASRSVGPGIVFDWEDSERQILLENHAQTSAISFSADGQRVATGTWKGRGVKIWNADTGEILQELPEIPGSASVVFSPDGRWIATSEESGYKIWDARDWTLVLRAAGTGGETPGPVAFAPDGAIAAVGVKDGGVRLIQVPGGEELATLVAPAPRPFQGLCFSPDGTRLAVSAAGAMQVWDLRAIRSQLGHLALDWGLPAYRPEPDGRHSPPLQWDSQVPSELEVATRPSAPVPNPVSEAELVQRLARMTRRPLAFASMRTGNLDIHLADPTASTFVNLTRNKAADSGPAWSPDGTQIAFESTRTGNYDIFVMNADGSHPQQLTNYDNEDRMPVWSPNGRSLCFRRLIRDAADNWELMVMNADGADVRNITNHTASEADPAWSSGERIAFGSNRDDQRRTVCTMQPDGTDVRKIRNFPTGWFPHPSWSPDGKRLAFTGTHYQDRRICVMDADGRNERPLTNLKGLSILASWSPDGRHIAFIHRADGLSETAASLYVMREDGTDLTEVGPVEGHINGGRPAWKP